jgi:DNA-binding NtrC family response regulator
MDETLGARPDAALTTASTPMAATVPTPPSEPALPKGALVIPPGERNLARIEALLVRAALDETGGQKSRAAELLGINRTTLYNKLRELDLGQGAGEEQTSEAGAG